MKEADHFAEGQKAYAAGKAQKKNPHSTGSRSWMRWNSGWVSAQINAGKVEHTGNEQVNKEKPS